MASFIEVTHMENKFLINLDQVVSVQRTDPSYRNANAQINTTNAGPILCYETYEKIHQLIARALTSR